MASNPHKLRKVTVILQIIGSMGAGTAFGWAAINLRDEGGWAPWALTGLTLLAYGFAWRMSNQLAALARAEKAAAEAGKSGA